MAGLIDIQLLIEVDTRGLDVIDRQFYDKVAQAVEDTADAATLNTIQNIVDQGLVLTGFMRDSVSNISGSNAWERHVVVGAYYSPPHEFGTHGQRARAFLRPGVAAEKKPFIQRIRGAFEV